jgi:hypothetical protein
MEVEGLKRMIPAWNDGGRIIGYCHDNDAKTRKAICGAD